MIVTFIQYLITNEMTRTRGGSARLPNNFDNRKFAAAKEKANVRRRKNRVKIEFV